MKKLILSLILISNSAMADYPHVIPSAGCPVGQICCPAAVVCDYMLGCGPLGQYYIDNEVTEDKYDGVKTGSLNNMAATGKNGKNYMLVCSYKFDKFNVTLKTFDSNFIINKIGAWQYTFAKNNALCQNNNSLDCTLGN